MGCAKGDEGNATAEGGAVSSEGRCDPAAGCTARPSMSAVAASPTRVDPASLAPRPALRVATAKGPNSTFRRKMRPRSGMHAPSQSIIAVAAFPAAARSRFAGPSCNAPGVPFARSLTKQTARKALSQWVAVKSSATAQAGAVIVLILPATRFAKTYSEVPRCP